MIHSQSCIVTEVLSKFKKSLFLKRVLERLKKKKCVFIKPSGKLFTEILAIVIHENGFAPVVLNQVSGGIHHQGKGTLKR